MGSTPTSDTMIKKKDLDAMKKQIMLASSAICGFLALLIFSYSVLYIGVYLCLLSGLWRLIKAILTFDTQGALWAIVTAAMFSGLTIVGVVATRIAAELSLYFYSKSK